MRSFNLWLYGLHQAQLLRQGRGQHLTTPRYLKNRPMFTKPQLVWLNISKTVGRRTSASLTLFVRVWMSNRNELQVTSHQEAVKTIMLGDECWMSILGSDSHVSHLFHSRTFQMQPSWNERRAGLSMCIAPQIPPYDTITGGKDTWDGACLVRWALTST